jgi:hypothetical protein
VASEGKNSQTKFEQETSKGTRKDLVTQKSETAQIGECLLRALRGEIDFKYGTFE